MPQARGTASTRAVDSLSDANPKILDENMSIVQNEDKSVILTTVNASGRITSRRVDSQGDLDHVSKGGKVWWQALLKQQKQRDSAKEAPKTSRKVTPKKGDKDE